jgi:hypothetical protein
VSQGNGAPAVPSHDEVERAIRSVPGVAEATIARAHDTGRGRLRIRLHPGEDAERVSWSVAATLRERFGIALDPDEIRPRVDDGHGEVEATSSVDVPADDAPAPRPLRTAQASERALNAVDDLPPAAEQPGQDPPSGEDGPRSPRRTASAAVTLSAAPDPSGDPRPWRPTIRDLSTRHDPDVVTVTARLELDGRVVAGEAAGAPTARGLRRAIADATVRAIGELTRTPLRAQVDRVSVGGNDPAAVSVVVSLLSGRGEELLLGAAIVRDDVEHAVMRATLDALNRRMEPELAV